MGSDVDGDCLGLAPTDLPLKVIEGELVVVTVVVVVVA